MQPRINTVSPTDFFDSLQQLHKLMYLRLKERNMKRPLADRATDELLTESSFVAALRVAKFHPSISDLLFDMVDGRMLDGLLVRLYLALVHFAPRNVLLGHPSFGPTAPRIFDADASKQFLNTQWASDSDLLARAQLVWQEELKAHQVAYFIIHHEGVSAHYSTVCVDWRYGEIVSYDSLGRLPPIFQDKVTSSLATLGLDPPLEWRHVTDTRQAFYSVDCLIFSLFFVERHMAIHQRYNEYDLPLSKYSKVFCEEVGDDVRRKLFLDIVMKRAIDLSPSCRLGNELPATNIIHDMRKPNASSTESWTISSGSEREVVDLMDTSSDTEDE